MQSSGLNEYSSGGWETIDYVKGTYSAKDCNSEHVHYIKLSKNILLKVSCCVKFAIFSTFCTTDHHIVEIEKNTIRRTTAESRRANLLR